MIESSDNRGSAIYDGPNKVGACFLWNCRRYIFLLLNLIEKIGIAILYRKNYSRSIAGRIKKACLPVPFSREFALSRFSDEHFDQWLVNVAVIAFD